VCFSVPKGSNFIEILACSLVALQSLTVAAFTDFVHANPSGPFPGHVVFLVFTRHHLLREKAAVLVEVHRIHGHQFGLLHRLELLPLVLEVALDEAAFLACVRMEVQLEEELVRVGQARRQLLYVEYVGLLLLAWVGLVAV